jgi:hypothetical protein
MAGDLIRRTYVMSGAAVALLAAALLVPRLFAGPGAGMAGAAAAALTFLALGLISAILSWISFSRALRNRARLPALPFAAGLAPLPLVLVCGTVVWALVTR